MSMSIQQLLDEALIATRAGKSQEAEILLLRAKLSMLESQAAKGRSFVAGLEIFCLRVWKMIKLGFMLLLLLSLTAALTALYVKEQVAQAQQAKSSVSEKMPEVQTMSEAEGATQGSEPKFTQTSSEKETEAESQPTATPSLTTATVEPSYAENLRSVLTQSTEPKTDSAGSTTSTPQAQAPKDTTTETGGVAQASAAPQPTNQREYWNQRFHRLSDSNNIARLSQALKVPENLKQRYEKHKDTILMAARMDSNRSDSALQELASLLRGIEGELGWDGILDALRQELADAKLTLQSQQDLQPRVHKAIRMGLALIEIDVYSAKYGLSTT